MGKVKSDKQVHSAIVDKSTIDTDKRQFWVVFATETPVRRRGWDETFDEVLNCSTENMRTQRLDNGVVPLLDNHDKYTGVNKQYGSVVSYSIKDNVCRALVQFSTRAEFTGIWDDIVAGIIRGISVNYIPWKYMREVVKDEIPVYRAIDWEPMELSLAPVPADFNSFTGRNQEGHYEIEILNNENRNMENENVTTEVVNPTAAPATQQRSEGTATPATPPPATPPAADPVNIEQERSNAVQAERKRVSEIESACRAAGMDAAFQKNLVNNGTSIDAARAAIINALAAKQSVTVDPVNPGISFGKGDGDTMRGAMENVIMFRSNPGDNKLEGKANEISGMKLVDMARYFVEEKGEKGFLPADTVVSRAIATTDFPDLLTNVVNKTLRKEYEKVPQNWKFLAEQTSLSDFRTKTGMRLDGAFDFDKIAEGGEYKAAKFLEDEKATIKLDTYGKKIVITRQAIVNDDLDVFKRIPKMFAQAASSMQARLFWDIINKNAKAPDGKAMFHADHGNLGTAAAMSEASLNAAIVAMSKQKSQSGQLIYNAPEYLIVPTELEMLARKLMAGVTANNTNDVNTLQGAFKIVSDPYLSVTDPKAWYLVNPKLEGVMYAYLDGKEGIYTESQTNFNDDTVETKARIDFAVALWDYKGWYKNPGQ